MEFLNLPHPIESWGWLFVRIVMCLLLIPYLGITLYFFLLSLAAMMNPERKMINGVFQGPRKATKRFLILIPAYNEELILHDILMQLKVQHYPRTHYEIIVLADNCSDATAEIARQAGVEVLERHDPDLRGKGQALDWAMRGPISSWPRPWDALVIVDADSIVNPDFLWFMQEKLLAGYQVMQGYYGVLNSTDNLRTALMEVALAALHVLRPLGRDFFGLSCGLKGNGMCFSRSLVERFGYPAGSVVEDLELSLLYLEHGIPVKFALGAQVLGQMARSSRQAHTQRVRWEGGRFNLFKKWTFPLFVEGIKSKNKFYIDAAIDLCIPPLAMLAIPALACWGGMLFIMLCHWSEWSIALFACWSLVLFQVLLYLIIPLVLIRAPLYVWLSLFEAPFFVAWKLLFYLKIFKPSAKKEKEVWIRTERTRIDEKPE